MIRTYMFRKYLKYVYFLLSAILDKNECKETPKVCEFDCINTEGGYQCKCGNGYRLASNRKSCIDIDECLLGNNTCPKFCVNTPGSFKCNCPSGHLEKYGTCIDVDECSITPNLCGPYGECVNTVGSFKCQCQLGFKINSDGNYCVGKYFHA